MTSEISGAYYLTSSVRYAKGVGKAKAYLLEKLGIKTILDLFWHFPTHYEDRSNLTPIGKTLPGKKQVIQGYLVVVSRLRPRKNFTII
jgi:ATP-dependent DNA helicase RecG